MPLNFYRYLNVKLQPVPEKFLLKYGFLKVGATSNPPKSDDWKWATGKTCIINDFLRNPHFRGGHNSWLTGYYVERASQFLCHFMYVVNFWKLHKLTVSASHNQLMVSPSHDQLTTSHRGAFCQFPFRWIYYCHSSKFTGNETGKAHLCAPFLLGKLVVREVDTTSWCNLLKFTT